MPDASRIIDIVLWFAQTSVSPGADYKPKSAVVAVALCREHGWRITIPVQLARFWLGLAIRPNDFKEFYYDGDEARHFEDAGLTFTPAPNFDLFKLSIIGQMIRLGIPSDATIGQLHDFGKHAGSGYFVKQNVRELLLADMVSSILNEREIICARAFLDAGEHEVQMHAPSDFNPADHDDAPRVWGWSLIEYDGETLLRAARIDGHPSIGSGDRLVHSSPVIWIDEAIGWCRTRSRFYRLMSDTPTVDEP